MSGVAVKRKIIAVQGNQANEQLRELVEEVMFRIGIDDRCVGRFSCSPWNVRQAAIGWLFMNGFIRCFDDIHTIEVMERSGDICVALKEHSSFLPHEELSPLETATPDDIVRLSSMLEERSQLFRRTGGVHCAALVSDGQFMAYEEDVSRHAAIDKVAGFCLENKIQMEHGILVFSGRIPCEIVHKMERMGCSMIIARSAPTDYACRMAEDKNITIIGFARDDTFNIYTCPHRISGI